MYEYFNRCTAPVLSVTSYRTTYQCSLSRQTLYIPIAKRVIPSDHPEPMNILKLRKYLSLKLESSLSQIVFDTLF